MHVYYCIGYSVHLQITLTRGHHRVDCALPPLRYLEVVRLVFGGVSVARFVRSRGRRLYE